MKTTDLGEALYLTKKTASQLTSLSVTTLDEYRRTGRLPFHRIGRRVLLRRDDLVRFVESCRVDAAGGRP